MKISLKWLNDFVDVRDYFKKPEELAKILTSAGIEVDGLQDFAKNFNHVVIGQILELGQHPKADRLTLCQVDVGDGKPRQIVCGAKNHKQGDKVVVALPGAILPGNFEIKLSKIRDVESQGMLSSESELGLKEESEGILILPKDVQVGLSFAEYQGLNDIIFELSITPNRADCLSHYGLAREVACLLGRSCLIPNPEFKTGPAETKKSIDLKLENSESCPRYSGRLVRSVKVGPSPAWLKARLEALDLKSINNVVDVTNYVMMELGQPLHAFDLAFLEGGEVRVGNSKAGESFISLDATEIKLTGEELMIRDAKKPVALAGVVGGKNSGVSESTKDLFIESAHFLPELVRRTSRKFGIETDSSYRFSRGTDPEVVVLALNRACELIQSVAGGEVASDFYDLYPKPIKAPSVSVNLKYVEDRLGYPVEAKAFETWMTRLSCQFQVKEGNYQITPPVYRWDLQQDVDFVEEFARLQGYDAIPENIPAVVHEPTPHEAKYLIEELLHKALTVEGFHQAVNYGFLSSVEQKQFLGSFEKLKACGLETSPEAIRIKNPLNERLDVMRLSLLPGLWQNALHNFRHGSNFGQIYECGESFILQDGYKERTHLALALWGQLESLWSKGSVTPPVFQLKASVERMLAKLQIQGYQWRTLDSNSAPEFLHPGQAASLFVEGRLVGFIGTLHPAILSDNKMRQTLAVAEFDVEKLMRGQPRLTQAKSISKFPSVERDMAFVLPKDIPAGDLIKEIKKAGGDLVQSAWIFDVFEGGDLKAEERSVSYRILCQKKDSTLSEEDLSQLQTQVIGAVQKKFSARIR